MVQHPSKIHGTRGIVKGKGNMAKTVCKAAKQKIVSRRGKPSIEWHKDGVPQYYCYGYKDMMTDELLEVCKECIDHVDRAEEDYEKWNNRE